MWHGTEVYAVDISVLERSECLDFRRASGVKSFPAFACCSAVLVKQIICYTCEYIFGQRTLRPITVFLFLTAILCQGEVIFEYYLPYLVCQDRQAD